MIEIKTESGHSTPLVVCDVCHGVVKGMGNVLFDVATDVIKHRFAHKACDDGGAAMWMELDMFLFYLVHNSAVSLARAERRAEMLGD